ncbi:hypothetical protein GCM10008906_08370 [Clostridium oceanicum]|uniref:Uncharacterized protein n=1 Tax=Clostridium oceanicum TaxID=1543 RepID=A0ABN1JBM5_9CLOT
MILKINLNYHFDNFTYNIGYKPLTFKRNTLNFNILNIEFAVKFYIFIKKVDRLIFMLNFNYYTLNQDVHYSYFIIYL